MSEEPRYSTLPQVEKAWNFPLFEAIVGRRSRRFGFGMELKHGPFSYKSNKEPMPLNEAETAMLVAAATGVTGAILCEGEFQGGMVKSVGRPHPSAVGSHRTELFFTNDNGVFLFRGTEQKMTKMKEYETPDDRDKILDFYRKHTVKLSDKRLDLPRQTPGLFHHNLWVTNTPGSTLFMPVTDISKDLIRLMINMCDPRGGRYIDGGGYYILDERKGMRPAGCEKWAAKGVLNKNKPLPLGRAREDHRQLALRRRRDDGYAHATRDGRDGTGRLDAWRVHAARRYGRHAGLQGARLSFRAGQRRAAAEPGRIGRLF